MAGSIMTWIYTYSPGSDEDSSGIKLPANLVSKSYDSAKYFYKAGIYMSHPWFNDCNENSQPWHNGTSLNWIKLESLMTIESAKDPCLTVQFQYNATDSFIVTRVDDDVNCFMATMPNCSVFPLSNCDNITLDNYATSLEFKFESIEYTKTLVFGDIKFKAIVHQPDRLICEELDVNHVGFLSTENETIAQLQYFKSKADVNDTLIYAQLSNGTDNSDLGYYQFPQDLFNVTDVWKTGYDQCAMTGSLAPNYGSKIDISC
jgi:hypothetical protein